MPGAGVGHCWARLGRLPGRCGGPLPCPHPWSCAGSHRSFCFVSPTPSGARPGKRKPKPKPAWPQAPAGRQHRPLTSAAEAHKWRGRLAGNPLEAEGQRPCPGLSSTRSSHSHGEGPEGEDAGQQGDLSAPERVHDGVGAEAADHPGDWRAGLPAAPCCAPRGGGAAGGCPPGRPGPGAGKHGGAAGAEV